MSMHGLLNLTLVETDRGVQFLYLPECTNPPTTHPKPPKQHGASSDVPLVYSHSISFFILYNYVFEYNITGILMFYIDRVIDFLL